MKTMLRFTLFFALTLICSATIAQNNNRAYKSFYKKINKGFELPQQKSNKNNNQPDCLDSIANNIKSLESSIKELEKILDTPMPAREVDDRPEKRIIYNSNTKQEPKTSSVTSPVPTPRLSITPKADPVKKVPEATTTKTSTSIVTPAATPKPTSAVTSVTSATPSTSLAPPSQSSGKPVAEKVTAPTSARNFKSASIEEILSTKPEVRSAAVTLQSGDKLKKYNVVIATLSTIQRANRLKAILFTESNDKVWIAKSEQNLYHFIRGSFDTEEEAINKRNSIIRYYTSKYSEQDLMNKYGIPFIDTWILVID